MRTYQKKIGSSTRKVSGQLRTPNPTEQWVRTNLDALLRGYQRKLGTFHAMSGMALGSDQIFTEVALALGIDVIAAVPFDGQESQWPEPAQHHYHQLLHQCSAVHHVCEPGYEAWKMLRRDAWMVERCTYAIAVWDGGNGGTGHTVGLLRKAGKPTVRIDPLAWAVGPLILEIVDDHPDTRVTERGLDDWGNR